MSLAEGDRLAFDAGVGGQVTELERLQEETQIGPCDTAFRSGQIVSASDLDAETDRWPEYCRTAATLGVGAVASIPMRLGEQTVGAVNLYAGESRVWDKEDMAAAVVLADMATAYLINASKHRQQVELAEQLQRALDVRVIIEQAKGMLAVRRGIAPDAPSTTCGTTPVVAGRHGPGRCRSCRPAGDGPRHLRHASRVSGGRPASSRSHRTR